MDFFDVLKDRSSIRDFKKTNVEDNKIEKILMAANSAPSAGNLQAFEVVLVKNQENRSALAKAAYGQSPISDAPICLVFLANPEGSQGRYGERGGTLYCLQDATIAAAYAQLAATNLGLASVWVGAFDDEAVNKAVNAPKQLAPIAILPIGYAMGETHSTSRRSIKDMVKYERF